MKFRSPIFEKKSDRELTLYCEEAVYSAGRWFVIGRCGWEDAIWTGDVFTALYRIVYPDVKPETDDWDDWKLYESLRTKQDIREVSLKVALIKCDHRFGGDSYAFMARFAQFELVGEGGELIRQGDILSTLEIATRPIT